MGWITEKAPRRKSRRRKSQKEREINTEEKLRKLIFKNRK